MNDETIGMACFIAAGVFALINLGCQIALWIREELRIREDARALERTSRRNQWRRG